MASEAEEIQKICILEINEDTFETGLISGSETVNELPKMRTERRLRFNNVEVVNLVKK